MPVDKVETLVLPHRYQDRFPRSVRMDTRLPSGNNEQSYGMGVGRLAITAGVNLGSDHVTLSRHLTLLSPRSF